MREPTNEIAIPARPPPHATSSPASHIQCELVPEKSIGTALTRVKTHHAIRRPVIAAQLENDIHFRRVATAHTRPEATITAATPSAQKPNYRAPGARSPSTAHRAPILAGARRADDRREQEDVVQLATTIRSPATSRQTDELEPDCEAPALVGPDIRRSIQLDAHCLSPGEAVGARLVWKNSTLPSAEEAPGCHCRRTQPPTACFGWPTIRRRSHERPEAVRPDGSPFVGAELSRTA